MKMHRRSVFPIMAIILTTVLGSLLMIHMIVETIPKKLTALKAMFVNVKSSATLLLIIVENPKNIGANTCIIPSDKTIRNALKAHLLYLELLGPFW